MMTEDERQRRQQIADVRRMMNQREGRRLMWRLLGMSEVYVVPAPASEAVTNFANGRRLIGTTLLNEIWTVCPEQYALMQTEAAQDAEQSALRREKENETGTDD